MNNSPTRWRLENNLVYKLSDHYRPSNTDEVRVTMANNSTNSEDCNALAAEIYSVFSSQPVGFDFETAANLVNGKSVTDDEVKKFVLTSRWTHADCISLSNTIAELRREIKQREAEISILKASLLADLNSRWCAGCDTRLTSLKRP